MLSLFRVTDLQQQFNRMVRQRMGDMTQLAIQRLFMTQKINVADIPETVSELLFDWIENSKWQWKLMVLRNPLRLLALWRPPGLEGCH